MRGRTVPQPAAGRGGALRAAAPRPAPPRGPRPPPVTPGTAAGARTGGSGERQRCGVGAGCLRRVPAPRCGAVLGSCRLGVMRFEGAAVLGSRGFRVMTF